MIRALPVVLFLVLVGFLILAMIIFTRRETLEIEAKCEAKGLEVFLIGEDKVCRDRDTGLLYAPP